MRSPTSILFVVMACVSLRSASAAADFGVRVEDSFFDPPEVAINVGDAVVWTGFGAQDHSVTSDDGLFNALVLFGDVFSYTFMEAGTFPYFCENHGNAGGGGMAGVIVVFAGGLNHAPNAPFNRSPADGAMNQPLTVPLQASGFLDSDARDFHASSQWLVRRASDNAIVFNTGEDSANKTNCTVAEGALASGSNYTWQVRYKDGRGEWSAYSSPTAFTTLVPVTQTGFGLLASYSNTAASSPLAMVTNGTIDFDWGMARPHRRITADNFSVVWEGSVLPQFTERYDFQFQYRGRARVWVKDQLLINEGAGCSFSQTRRGGINLVGGQLASIRVEYTADATGGLATLRWTSPGVPMQVIPSTRLFPTPP
jgi:plastocyanin